MRKCRACMWSVTMWTARCSNTWKQYWITSQSWAHRIPLTWLKHKYWGNYATHFSISMRGAVSHMVPPTDGVMKWGLTVITDPGNPYVCLLLVRPYRLLSAMVYLAYSLLCWAIVMPLIVDRMYNQLSLSLMYLLCVFSVLADIAVSSTGINRDLFINTINNYRSETTGVWKFATSS